MINNDDLMLLLMIILIIMMKNNDNESIIYFDNDSIRYNIETKTETKTFIATIAGWYTEYIVLY